MSLAPLTYIASADTGIFGALGIDWKTLIVQIVAFLLLVWLLGKFVYPLLMKSVDERMATIDAATEAAAQAQTAADNAQTEVAKLLKEAQKNADDIIATAKLESANAYGESEAKAQKRAEQLVLDARAEIHKEVSAAKKELYNETLELVTLATEKVVGTSLSDKVDSKLIDDALKAVK